jgi:cellobiose-specific phosphotransferase system component IIC
MAEFIELISILLIIFLAIPFIISTLISIWVYRDSKKKGLNSFIWVLTVWIIPFFIGLILYLRARD